MHYCNPKEVRVREGLERFRKDMGEVNKLAESIKKYGQLLPIVVTRDMELIAGGRRLSACLHAGIDVLYTIKEDIDELTLRELELEENIQRKDFSPAEEALAVAEIHKLKQKQYGVANGGGKGWSMEDTAKYLGQSKASICRRINAASLVEQFSLLKKCKDISEFNKNINLLQRAVGHAKAICKAGKSALSSDIDELWTVGDVKEILKKIPSDSTDLLLTDPPYGIDIVSKLEGSGGIPGGVTFKDTLCPDDIKILAEESFRICKDTAFAVVFLAIDFFQEYRQFFQEAGWLVAQKPLIWVKEGGSSLCPSIWPVSSYEIALFAKKVQARIVNLGFRDIISGINAVHGSNKVHVSEKPIALFQHIIRNLCLPGSYIVDPFAGSGSSLIAGLREKNHVLGGDIMPVCRSLFSVKLAEERGGI